MIIRQAVLRVIICILCVTFIPFQVFSDTAEMLADIVSEDTEGISEIRNIEQMYSVLLSEESYGEKSAICYGEYITPEKSSVVAFNGVRVEIPEGAVEKETLLSITALSYRRGELYGLSNATSGALSYRFGPSGIRFKKNIRISIPFDKQLLKSETALSNLFTYFFDESSGKWERLPRVQIDREQCCIISLSNHFTDMINASLQMPENQEPIDFNINSIKGLEAANPVAGIPELSGLKPNL